MHTPALSHKQLGETIRAIWSATQSDLVVGQFVHGLLKPHPSFSETQTGAIVTAALQTSMADAQLGAFVYSQYGQLSSSTEHQKGAGTAVAAGGVTESRVLELLNERLAQLDGLNSRALRRSTTKFNVTVNGRSTSVSLYDASVARFTEVFGVKRLRALIKVVANEKGDDRVPRSVRVQQAVDQLLQQLQDVTYPHGIKVIHGGS